MNKVILMGRLTRDPEVRYAQNENGTAVARYSLAVDDASSVKESRMPTSSDALLSERRLSSLRNGFIREARL